MVTRTHHLLLTVVLILVLLPRTEACSTDYGRGPPCVFPFRLGGELYLSCTTRPVPGSGRPGPVLPPHCPTRVDPDTLEASTEVSVIRALFDFCRTGCQFLLLARQK